MKSEVFFALAYGQLKQFRVGERVSFEWYGRTIVGIVERVNQKTVTVATAEGGWRIPPRNLTKDGL